MTNPSLKSYISGGHLSVQGWLDKVAIELVVACARVQNDLGIRGPVCEIGVHHGRLLILLHLLCEASGEMSVGYDLFDWQEHNVDHSGRGDLERVRQNLRDHGCNEAGVKLVRANSLNLTRSSVLDDCAGSPRLFSVDGGHTCQITRNDVALAQAALCAGGVVIVDDFFNPDWPEVSLGVAAHLQSDKCELIPFGIGGNKFFFTNEDNAAQRYRDAFQNLSHFPQKRSSVIGHEVTVVSPTHRTLAQSGAQFLNDLLSACTANVRSWTGGARRSQNWPGPKN